MRVRIAAVICLVVGAALMAGGVFGHRWASLAPAGEIGLLATVDCPRAQDPCAEGLHGATTPTRIEGEQFARLGQIAFILGVLAALGALVAAHPRAPRALGVPTSALALGAVAAATAFAITEPFGQFAQGWRPGPAWWLCASGAALIVAGVRLGPAETPREWKLWAALAAAALALALTAQSTWWWRGPQTTYDTAAAAIAVGPAMVEVCPHDAPCAEERLGDAASLGTGPTDLPAPQADLMGTIVEGVLPDASLSRPGLIAGRALAVAAALAAVLAAALAIATAAQRRARALAWATLGASAAAVIAILVFEARMSSAVLDHLGAVHRSMGLPIALVGVALAIAPALRLALAAPRALEPLPLPLASPVSASGPVPATIPPCPACRAPMMWISKRKTWLCTLCKTRVSVPP